jgi:hypothetical protein
VFVQASAKKIHFCFIMIFQLTATFQLAASLRPDAKSSLRSLRAATVLDTPAAAGGAKPKDELDEQRSLGKKKVVTVTLSGGCHCGFLWQVLWSR